MPFLPMPPPTVLGFWAVALLWIGLTTFALVRWVKRTERESRKAGTLRSDGHGILGSSLDLVMLFGVPLIGLGVWLLFLLMARPHRADVGFLLGYVVTVSVIGV